VPSGSLTVVGTGIRLGMQLTPEARAALTAADEVLYLVPDEVAMTWIERLNPRSRSLHEHYQPGRNRSDTYAAMVDEIVGRVRAGADVCVAFYGHPGVFVRPAHEAVRRVRAEGRPAEMLPSVSAEDCLFADLGVDPGEHGCQSYEATDFLLRRRRVDPGASLILWQISMVGNLGYSTEPDTSRLHVLAGYLSELYPPAHEVVLYEAAAYPGAQPLVQRIPLADLAHADVATMTTLHVPPLAERPSDREMSRRLGLAAS
jgi:uncharacterized protein YabN with tetrapyrrole methylase and pyrophosphatase domain